MGARRGTRVTIHLHSPEDQVKLSALEAALEAAGVTFDTGHDMKKGLRDWELDESLEGPLTPREILSRLRGEGFRFTLHRKPRPRRRRYRVGDVFRVRLGPNHFGYGRVLFRNTFPTIFVEFYKTVAERDLSQDVLRDMKVILRLYTLDAAIAEDRTWAVVGHIPVKGEPVYPMFWTKDALDDKLYLFEGPVYQGLGRPTTQEEIRRLGAQPGGIYASVAAENALKRALRDAGFSLTA